MEPSALSAGSSHRIVRDSARRSAGRFAARKCCQLSVLQDGIQLRYRGRIQSVQLCESRVDLLTVRVDRAQIAIRRKKITKVCIFEVPREVAIGETKFAIREL